MILFSSWAGEAPTIFLSWTAALLIGSQYSVFLLKILIFGVFHEYLPISLPYSLSLPAQGEAMEDLNLAYQAQGRSPPSTGLVFWFDFVVCRHFQFRTTSYRSQWNGFLQIASWIPVDLWFVLDFDCARYCGGTLTCSHRSTSPSEVVRWVPSVYVIIILLHIFI